jgi:hypothetical protein
VAPLFDDQIVPMGLDQVLDRRLLVTGDDDEPARVRAEHLVLLARELDQARAAAAGALAAEGPGPVIAGPEAPLDGLVDAAMHRLIAGDHLVLPHVAHARDTLAP